MVFSAFREFQLRRQSFRSLLAAIVWLMASPVAEAQTRTQSEDCHSAPGHAAEFYQEWIERYCQQKGFRQKAVYVATPADELGWHCVNKQGRRVAATVDLVAACDWWWNGVKKSDVTVRGVCYLGIARGVRSDDPRRYESPACVFAIR